MIMHASSTCVFWHNWNYEYTQDYSKRMLQRLLWLSTELRD